MNFKYNVQKSNFEEKTGATRRVAMGVRSYLHTYFQIACKDYKVSYFNIEINSWKSA